MLENPKLQTLSNWLGIHLRVEYNLIENPTKYHRTPTSNNPYQPVYKSSIQRVQLPNLAISKNRVS